MNFEILRVNRIADLGRGGSRGSEGGSVEKRLNIRKQPSFSRNLSCTLNHDPYASFLTTGLLYNSTKPGQNVQLNQQEKRCKPFLCGFFVNVPDV